MGQGKDPVAFIVQGHFITGTRVAKGEFTQVRIRYRMVLARTQQLVTVGLPAGYEQANRAAVQRAVDIVHGVRQQTVAAVTPDGDIALQMHTTVRSGIHVVAPLSIIAGNAAAVDVGGIAAAVHAAAIILSSVPGDGAIGHYKAASVMHAAAISFTAALRGCVVGNVSAGHGEAIAVRHTGTVIGSAVLGDGTAVHIEGSLVAHALAVFGELAAVHIEGAIIHNTLGEVFNGTAIQVQGACIALDIHAGMLLIRAHDAAGAYAIRDGQRAVDPNVVYRVGRGLDLVSVQAQCYVPCEGMSCAQLHILGQVVVTGCGQAVAFLPLFEVYRSRSRAVSKGTARVVAAAAEIVRFVGRSGQDAIGGVDGIIAFRAVSDIGCWIIVVNGNLRIGDQPIDYEFSFSVTSTATAAKINAAACFAASRVVRDLHVIVDADIRLRFAANIYTAAAVHRAVAGNGTAVHLKYAIGIHTAAAARYLVAGDDAAVHGKIAVFTHLHSRAFRAIRMGDLAGARAVGDGEVCLAGSAGAVHLDRRIGTVHGNAVTVEAQHNGRVALRHHPCLVEHNIASQIIGVSFSGQRHFAVFILFQCFPCSRTVRMRASVHVVCTAHAVVVRLFRRLHLRGQHTQRRQYQCQQAH